MWRARRLGCDSTCATALNTPWILDCDTTIKVPYGWQQAGAVVNCNPHKPVRPSHAIHTHWIGHLPVIAG